MKIKTVELPTVEHPDGTESSSSDAGEYSVASIRSPAGNAGKLNHGVDARLTPSMISQYEETMGMLAAAMTELQMELRDKTNECEALYETAHSLSQALQESDRLLQNKTLECERLSLKLQMVSFCELNDEDSLGIIGDEFFDFDSADTHQNEEYFTIPQRPAAILDQLPHIQRRPEGSVCRSNAVKPKPEPSRPPCPKNSSEDAFGSDNSTNDSVGVNSGPVCVDDCDDEDDAHCENKECSEAVDEKRVSRDSCQQSRTRTNQNGNVQISIGPSQAHFYHVILERDMAKQTNAKLSRDLRYTRGKLRELKTKLDQSTSLLELAYDNNRKNGKCRDVQKPHTVSVSEKTSKACKSIEDVDSMSKVSGESYTSASARASLLPWRRNHGIGSTSGLRRTKQDHLNITEYVSYISDEEMLSKNWNNTSAKAMDAAATEKYLKVMLTPEDDADRAGGGGTVPSTLFDA